MAMTTALPAGEFPLHIGQSFQESVGGTSYHSLRYDFKPASVNTEAPGSLTFGADGQVSLDLLRKGGDEAGLAFTGYSEPYGDELDCVAMFDGSSWTFQLLSGALKVQHVKGHGRATPPPQVAPAALPNSSAQQLAGMDAACHQAKADALVARDHSQEASETHLASDHLLSAMTGHSPDSSGDTQSEQDDAQPAQQSLSTAVASQPTGATHAHFNGHAQHQSRSQLRHPEGSASQGEEEEEEEDDEEDTMQEASEHQAHVATGAPMTDLERQFFSNSQPVSSDSSDSSSDSDHESMNAGTDDDDDGLDHF